MDTLWVISTYTVSQLFSALGRGNNTSPFSLDLGLTTVEILLSKEGIHLPDESMISWAALRTVHEDTHSCFRVENNEIIKIEAFSEFTGRYYSLYPTPRAPTMLVSGIPMHRIKDTEPFADTLAKMRAAKPIGQILDTTTGLGYTAIEAAKMADHVTTIELDPVVLDICRCNPWSQRLFDNPHITQKIGDSFELIQEFPDEFFSRVVHDPPTLSLAGDLYSGEFYAQVYRVLRFNGRLFHYIGDLNSSSGKRVARGTTQRLLQAGFKSVSAHPEAFALVAFKR